VGGRTVSAARSRRNLTKRRLNFSTVPVTSRPSPESIAVRVYLFSRYTHETGSSRSGASDSGPAPGSGMTSWSCRWVLNMYPGPWPDLPALKLEVLEDLPVGVYTLPLRVRSRGRAPARPMDFPPPLVPHTNCEPRRPLPTGRWDWVVCRNDLWANRVWSAICPGPHLGEWPQSPPVLLPVGKTVLHRASVPERGTLAVSRASVPRGGSSR
jgi:hypothetical protein